MGITVGAAGFGDGAPPHPATIITTNARFTPEGY
jgi:hypothetical protein